MYIQSLKTLASRCSWVDRFESYLVENPEDRFSRDVAQIRHRFDERTPGRQDTKWATSWDEIMVLFVLHIIRTRIRSHAVRLYVWFLIGPFIYFHTSCVRTAKALARLCRCAGSLEPSIVACVISSTSSWAGSNVHWNVLHFIVESA